MRRALLFLTAAAAVLLAACNAKSPTAPEATHSPVVTAAAATTGVTGDSHGRGHDAGGKHHGGAGGSKPTDGIVLQIAPDVWNTNLVHANGTIAAILRGATSTVDKTSIQLVGDDPSAAPVAAVSVRPGGSHLTARFPMAAAFKTLLNPKAGELHTITIQFTDAGGAESLQAQIRVVGP